MGFSIKTFFSKMKRDLIGLFGTVITSLCCLGIPAVISLVSAIGLGFLLKDAILVPLLMLFLFITLMGPYLGLRYHSNPWPLVLGTLSALMTLTFSRLVANTPLALIGLTGLASASVLNTWLKICRLEKDAHVPCELTSRKRKVA